MSCDEAYAKILRLASVKERSSVYLRKRLSQEGFCEQDVEWAIERAMSVGIVDDARYAEAYLHTKLNAGRGKAGIISELENLNIDLSVLGDEIETDEDSELTRALQFLEHHPSHSKNKRDGAYRKLMQKGYGSSVSAEAARIWSESCDEL
jgi:regulatory protein